jgi:FMN phosphatase YigB (HAD superfamily)
MAPERHVQAVLFDSGDTLVDEGSEVRNPRGEVVSGELLPGADALLRTLKQRGYKLALVADGRLSTYLNVFGRWDLLHLFDALSVSEIVGAEKPDPLPFLDALGQLGLPAAARSRTMMIGNRLDRDVLGSNRLGLISVWFDWSPRYRRVPRTEEEVPNFRITALSDVLKLLDELAGRDAG